MSIDPARCPNGKCGRSLLGVYTACPYCGHNLSTVPHPPGLAQAEDETAAGGRTALSSPVRLPSGLTIYETLPGRLTVAREDGTEIQHGIHGSRELADTLTEGHLETMGRLLPGTSRDDAAALARRVAADVAAAHEAGLLEVRERTA